jgi:hypothetical protein
VKTELVVKTAAVKTPGVKTAALVNPLAVTTRDAKIGRMKPGRRIA